ncbi:MAG TPA: penicillin acylase family protein [Ferruginibacter sp.]|nr:penicillin acylase family protein [Ferruginibacter sp.]
MKKITCFLILTVIIGCDIFAQPFSQAEISRWQNQSKNVSIIRDNFGIPHIYGKTDANAVFGLMYAQCEDDFKRVEMNYIDKLGRLSEIEGEKELAWDLLNRILFDSAEAVNDYNNAAPWMKQLCNAFADGINYYLYKNASVKPALLNRFKPWYPFLWTDGSINAINTAGITDKEFSRFYFENMDMSMGERLNPQERPTGSNGFAFAPKITASGNAILYINPHVTFYFRPEVHMVSEQGLNVYGAVTWGQFFVYQGFNEHCGWMHTSSGVDAGDTYIEKISKKDKGWVYAYENSSRPVIEKKIQLKYRADDGMISSKNITVLFTHHGPIMANRKGEILSLRADNRIANGLVQCWQRTKAKGLADFKKTLDLKGNISNNTVYADAQGNIGYWHGNRIPIRDKNFNWEKPVDGSIASTEWKGQHAISEIVQSINPVNGWLQNCNSTPFTVAGVNSPARANESGDNIYPAYMAPDGENFRGINAVRVLDKEKAYTIDKVIAAGYDTYLPAFEKLLPALFHAFETNVHTADTLYPRLIEQITVLKKWDMRCGVNSIATTLAVEWGQKLIPKMARTASQDEYEYLDQVIRTERFAATATAHDLIQPLLLVIAELKDKFGTWQVPWGDINRFQRISGDINQKYDDAKPSVPVGFASSTWGMLPSYSANYFPGTKKRYGVNGNSFIAAVEFGQQGPAGKKIKARSLLAGGQSGDPNSPHFKDQLEMYSKGEFKNVLFYKEDVLKHAKRTYHPGE